MKAITLEQHVLSIVCSVFDAYSAVLFMPDGDSDAHTITASFSLGDKIVKDTVILPGRGLVGTIIMTRQAMVSKFDTSQKSLGYYDDATEREIKAFMGCPVPTGGVLCVDSKRQYSFADKDLKILQLFADLIARQQRFAANDISDSISRYFSELGRIQNMRFEYKRWPEFLKNFLRSVSEATEFEYCAFATLQEAGDHYCLECESVPLLLTGGQVLRLPLGSGITGIVFHNEQAFFAEDGGLASSAALFGKIPDMPEFPAAICMPVMVNKSCRGVLCLANTEPKEIEESRRSFVRQAVDHLSLFLESLYLKNRLLQYIPKANLEWKGARMYNPDTAPNPRQKDDEDQE